MRIDRPAERAAGILGVDRHRRAAATHDTDDLATAALAFAHRRGAGVRQLAVVEAVAIGTASADGERARRLGGAGRGGQGGNTRAGERQSPPKSKHRNPPRKKGFEANREWLLVGEFDVLPRCAGAEK